MIVTQYDIELLKIFECAYDNTFFFIILLTLIQINNVTFP